MVAAPAMVPAASPATTVASAAPVAAEADAVVAKKKTLSSRYHVENKENRD